MSDKLSDKAISRNNSLLTGDGLSCNEAFLNELDMGDLIDIIQVGSATFNISSKHKKAINEVFSKIIPIRNKVMHTRPIEFSDRGTLEETLHTLDRKLSFIKWNELVKTRDQLRNNPQKLIVETTFTPEVDDTTSIYHNLPVPEFDDTGYIGRKKEIKELTKLLESDKNQIITVIGNGGIGKTAIVVKCLYELLDSSNSRGFEAIIWVSLKTKTLSKGEFVNIRSSIGEINKMYSVLQKYMVEETSNSENDILTFMEEFSTLLVIDNLETVPTEAIIDFLKKIPSKSKVLITSRSGLGELENRYVLAELNKKDARMYFISLSRYYQLNIHEQEIQIIDDLIEKHLYSSPLSIKWYITSLFFGADTNTLLSNKSDLVEFSMSNIIEKLTENEIKVLWLLLVEGKSLSYGEIDYYIVPEHSQLLISSINKLLSTSMLRNSIGGKYEINNMAKDYLKVYRSPDSSFIRDISQKRTILNRMMQEIKTKNEADPFSPRSLFNNLKNENTKIASYYLIMALESSSKKHWKESSELIKKAENVAPDYFEIYKVKAFINAENNNLMDAIDSYRIAIENAHEDTEKASVYYLFSVFYTIKLQDYIQARECIEEAEKYISDEPRITLEKGRIYMYLGEFEEALNIFKSIDTSKNRTDKFANQYVSKISDLYRRMAENYGIRDSNIKFEYLEKSIKEIDKLNNIDQMTCATLIRSLADLSFILSLNKALDLFVITFRKHIGIIQNNSSGYLKKLRQSIIYNESILPDDIIEKSKNLGLNFNDKVPLETEEGKGIIVKLTEYYGFIKNSYHDYYFKVHNINYTNPKVGDRVNFVERDTPKGKIAMKILKIGEIKL
ncbi:NB-ARC domain-containing protein [Bacillus sp. FSL M7-0307]|uniref:NB-ARC domain-containing protein n=1 Tax=Bacillus sp. FSL M7-0307 TaxID=2921530 RepID=UPI00315A2475